MNTDNLNSNPNQQVPTRLNKLCPVSLEMCERCFEYDSYSDPCKRWAGSVPSNQEVSPSVVEDCNASRGDVGQTIPKQNAPSEQ